MAPETVFKLETGVQVRKEVFGLLFYNYRGPRLYFVPTGDLIGDDFFQGCQTVTELIDAVRRNTDLSPDRVREQIHHVLEMIERKGLAHGQPLC